MSDEKKSSWDEPRHAKFTHEEDVAFLRRAIEASRLSSRARATPPFGAILVNGADADLRAHLHRLQC